MSKQEKRHFSIDSLKEGGGKPPGYFRLFEAFNSMDEFSQNDLIQACKDEAFLPHLSSKCDYLKEKIIQSILYHRNKNDFGPDSELRSILDEVEILFERNLLFFCRKKLRKGKKLAEQFGLPGYLLEILTWERRILRGLRVPRNQKDLAQTKKEEDLALEQLKISTQLIQTLDEASFPSEGKSVDNSYLKIIDEIPRSPNLLTFRSKRALNELKAMKAVREGKPQLALERKKDNYLIWKNDPAWLQRNPERFIAACNSYLRELNASANYTLFREVMEEARSNTDLPRSSRPLMNISLSNLELIYQLNHLDLEGLSAAADSFTEKIEHLRKHIGPNKRQSYCYNLGLAYYISGQKKKAKVSFQEIINSPKRERIQNLQNQAFLWRQVILYETDLESFQYFYSHATNHFKKTANSPVIALPLLKCLNKNAKTGSVRIQIQNFKSFFELYVSDSSTSHSSPSTESPPQTEAKITLPPQYQPFLTWVRSKLQDKSFLELLKE